MHKHSGQMEVEDLAITRVCAAGQASCVGKPEAPIATITSLTRNIIGAGVDERLGYQIVDSDQLYFPRTNHQGSTVLLTTEDGALHTGEGHNGAFAYDEYGNATGNVPAAGYPYRYTGRRLDAETGLYYYRARYYDPKHGRFLQTDPIGYADQMNLYAYVHNDPMNMIDPSGEDTITDKYGEVHEYEPLSEYDMRDIRIQAGYAAEQFNRAADAAREYRNNTATREQSFIVEGVLYGESTYISDNELITMEAIFRKGAAVLDDISSNGASSELLLGKKSFENDANARFVELPNNVSAIFFEQDRQFNFLVRSADAQSALIATTGHEAGLHYGNSFAGGWAERSTFGSYSMPEQIYSATAMMAVILNVQRVQSSEERR